MPRTRLPRRRYAVTFDILVGQGHTVVATVGLNPADNLRPSELFLTGIKTGADMAAVLDDISVVVSVALQHGITAREMAHSVSPGHASVLGAALELIAGFEEDGPDHTPRTPDLKLVPPA